MLLRVLLSLQKLLRFFGRLGGCVRRSNRYFARFDKRLLCFVKLLCGFVIALALHFVSLHFIRLYLTHNALLVNGGPVVCHFGSRQAVRNALHTKAKLIR